ncbi:MAG: hypothetical protein ABI577_15500 [bacterium]
MNVRERIASSVLLVAISFMAAEVTPAIAYNPGSAPNGVNGACRWGGASQFGSGPYSSGSTWENTPDCNSISVVHWAWDGSAYVQFGGVSGSGTAIAVYNWTTPTSWVTSDHAGLWINWPYATSSIAN